MKKIFLLFIISICCIQLASSQTTLSTYEFRDDFIAYEADLPVGFRYIIPDSSQQLIANPARGYFYERPQAFSTAFQNNDGTVGLRGVALFNSKGDDKWFLTYSTNTENQRTESDQEFSTIRNNSNVFGSTVVEERDEDIRRNVRDDLRNQTSLEARLLKVRQKGSNLSSAFGVVGIFENITFESQSRVFRSSEDLTEVFENGDQTSRTERVFIRDEFTNSDNTSTRIGVAFEYYSARPKEDTQLRLSYQYIASDFDVSNRIETENTEIQQDFNPDNTSTNRSEIVADAESDNQLKGNVFHFLFTNQKSVNWFGDDYLTYSGTLSHAFGDDDIFSNSTSSNVQITNGTVTNEEEFGGQFSDAASDRLYSGNLQLGYAVRKEIDALTFITGLNGTAFYSTIIDYTSQGSIGGYFKNESDILRLSSNFPVFAKVDLSDFVAIWGGVNLTYFIEYSDVKSSLENQVENASLLNFVTTQVTTNRLQGQRSAYLGMRYKHRSGFKIIANFMDNLSNIERWRVTIGYDF